MALIFAPILELRGQDYAFSQFYANPVYLNPSMAGMNECPEIHLGYRNQWPALGKSFVSMNFSTDFRIEKASGAAALMVNNNRAGEGGLTDMGIGFVYAQRVRLSRDLYMSAALQIGLINRSINFSRLVFYDQINIETGISNAHTNQQLPEASFMVPDLSTGLSVRNGKIFAGAAVHHINRPEHSFYDNSSARFELPMKITVHSGATLPLVPGISWSSKPELEISPNLMYQRQGDFQQLNFGVYLSRRYLTGGFWYRNNFKSTDAVVFTVGIEAENLRFGYSYDVYVQEATSRFGGSHEVSLGLQFNCSSKKRSGKTINWPVF